MAQNLERRQLQSTLPFSNLDEVFDLREKTIQLRKEQEALQHERATTASAMAKTKDRAEKQTLIERGKELKARTIALEKEQATLEDTLQVWEAAIPNWSDELVHELSEERVVEYVGEHERIKALDPERHSHLRIGKEMDLFMWPEAARTSGARFAVLRNGAALLELALVNWVIGRLTATHGFTPLLPPDLVRPRYAASCGFQPRGQHSQTYHVTDHDMCLAATSEISVAALHEGRLFKASELPLRYAAFSHCFRAEAGSSGADEAGLYRLHQFSKVEMFAVTDEKSSVAMHFDFLGIQKTLIEELGLHARVIDMPPHELGASASRKFDIEAYFPSRQGYREVTSASNCTSYQSRRLLLRYDDDQDVRHYAHTVNATAIAIPRVLMCILETHLQPDGRVKIPAPLLPFMHGLTHIAA